MIIVSGGVVSWGDGSGGWDVGGGVMGLSRQCMFAGVSKTRHRMNSIVYLLAIFICRY